MKTKMKKYGAGGVLDGDKPKKGLLKRIFGRKTDEEKKQELIDNPGSKPEIKYTNPYSKPQGKKGMVVKTTYKTGGMVNSNTKVQADKTPGSKGVKSGINTKVSASKKAKGKVGGISTAPKKATPGKK
jgi:hypothetical protein